jgi:hypothetical protein
MSVRVLEQPLPRADHDGHDAEPELVDRLGLARERVVHAAGAVLDVARAAVARAVTPVGEEFLVGMRPVTNVVVPPLLKGQPGGSGVEADPSRAILVAAPPGRGASPTFSFRIWSLVMA